MKQKKKHFTLRDAFLLMAVTVAAEIVAETVKRRAGKAVNDHIDRNRARHKDDYLEYEEVK